MPIQDAVTTGICENGFIETTSAGGRWVLLYGFENVPAKTAAGGAQAIPVVMTPHSAQFGPEACWSCICGCCNCVFVSPTGPIPFTSALFVERWPREIEMERSTQQKSATNGVDSNREHPRVN